MGCGFSKQNPIQDNSVGLTFDQQLLEIDKQVFFENKKPFQILLQPIKQSSLKEKDETDSQDEQK